MYFNNNRSNTNIDKEFNQTKINLSLLNKINKKTKIIIITIIISILLLVMIPLILYEKVTHSLALNGDIIVTLYQGSDYIEPGYNAYNSKQKNLTSNVKIESNLNTDVIGQYEIKYTIGEVTETRIINVIEKTKEYTYIYLNTVNNSVNIYLKVGDTYTEPGYQVFNSAGHNLTNRVTVTGSVDTSKKGNYQLTYSLIDPNGVVVSAKRTVVVMDSNINLSLDNTNYTNGEVTINAIVIDEYFDYMILPNNETVTNHTYLYKVNDNGTYKFTVYNRQGNSKDFSIQVKNIDKTSPTGTCSGSYKNGISTINVVAKDNTGIDRYVVNGITSNQNPIIINKELSNATITIYDKAGNTNLISCALTDKNDQVVEQKPTPQQPVIDTPSQETVRIKYDLSESQLRSIAMLCQREQGTPIGAAAEASLMANRFELYGRNITNKKGGTGLYTYIRNAKWWANAEKHMDNTSSLNNSTLEAVRQVLVYGNRTLPPYVDEHDCIKCGNTYDIIKIITNGTTITDKNKLLDRSNYIKDNTIIYNRYSSTYTFYSFPTATSDPFGYTNDAIRIINSRTN